MNNNKLFYKISLKFIKFLKFVSKFTVYFKFYITPTKTQDSEKL